MARERKPLIEPGSLLPPAETLMGRILERDRQSAGRAPQKTPEPPDSDADNITSNITAHITEQAVSKEVISAGRQAVSKPRRQAGSKEAEQAGRQADAQLTARAMATTPAIPITLRLPTGLNDWLDDYAHAHRKDGVKKQDLVARAVELLVISLSLGDDD